MIRRFIKLCLGSCLGAAKREDLSWTEDLESESRFFSPFPVVDIGTFTYQVMKIQKK